MNQEKTINLMEDKIQKLLESIKPPTHIREMVDIGYVFQNNTLELFEIRPRWDKKDERIKESFAKTRLIKSQNIWKIYWMRASGKWMLYEPNPEVKDIADFFKIVKEDLHHCFFG
jgi:hypothetical protein